MRDIEKRAEIETQIQKERGGETVRPGESEKICKTKNEQEGKRQSSKNKRQIVKLVEVNKHIERRKSHKDMERYSKQESQR